MRVIEKIVIHCSGTSPSEDIGEDMIATVHAKKGIRTNPHGYHALILRNGQVIKGRSIERQGAHVRGYNEDSIGICLIGGLKEDGMTILDRMEQHKYGTPEFNYTKAQMTSLDLLQASYAEEFPNAETCGHRDFPGVHKACPCFDVGEYFGRPVIG